MCVAALAAYHSSVQLLFNLIDLNRGSHPVHFLVHFAGSLCGFTLRVHFAGSFCGFILLVHFFFVFTGTRNGRKAAVKRTILASPWRTSQYGRAQQPASTCRHFSTRGVDGAVWPIPSPTPIDHQQSCSMATPPNPRRAFRAGGR
jgi:hypothetical protein